jgi:hypothetical protein
MYGRGVHQAAETAPEVVELADSPLHFSRALCAIHGNPRGFEGCSALVVPPAQAGAVR